MTFYSDGEQFDTGTCQYDGTLTLPETDPTKTGYTFDGWKVRRANAPAPTYTACSQIQDETTCGQYSENGCAWENSGCHLKDVYSAPSESWCEDMEDSYWRGGHWCYDESACAGWFGKNPEPCG